MASASEQKIPSAAGLLFDQRANAQDLHHALKVVGEYMQTHLGAHSPQRLGQEVCGVPIHALMVPNGCSAATAATTAVCLLLNIFDPRVPCK